MRFIDITGQRFERLSVVSIQRRGKGKRPLWECLCDCGGTVAVLACALKSGNTKSCGCIHKERLRKRLTTHGKTGTPLYTAWYGVKTRVSNPNQRGYKNYGGRGIGMHPEWAGSFEAFEAYILDFLGEKPEGKSLDRIDNSKGYVPGNLRWATPDEQVRNTRTNIWLQFEGRPWIMEDLRKHLGITKYAMRRHVREGKYSLAQESLDTIT